LGELLAVAKRGGHQESWHYGSIAVTDRSGKLLYAVGNPAQQVFARSSLKPFQAVPVITTGAAGRFGFGTRELAVICASHNGEPVHTELVADMLKRLKLDADDLRCGAHPPYNKDVFHNLLRAGKEPGQLHNNCSGKHAGMLALSLQIGADPDTYYKPDHPVQQLIRSTMLSLAELKEGDIGTGIDGCGVPTYAMPLQRMAMLFARLGDPSGCRDDGHRDALERVLEAMRAYPELVEGDGEFDTELCRATGGAVVGKIGAEGIYGLTLPKLGLGVAVEIDDGNARAAYPTVMEVLKQLQVLDGETYARLGKFHLPEMRNHRGETIGTIETVFILRQA